MFITVIIFYHVLMNMTSCLKYFQQSQHIWYQLAMFFRDELLSWSWRKPFGLPTAPMNSGGTIPVDFEKKVITNVEQVLSRVKGIAPQCLDEVSNSLTSTFHLLLNSNFGGTVNYVILYKLNNLLGSSIYSNHFFIIFFINNKKSNNCH